MSLLGELLDNLTYLPIMSVRPSEMNAYQELPLSNKESILPLILLKPWLNSTSFENTTRRVTTAVGEYPWIASIDEKYRTSSTNLRPAIEEFYNLQTSDNGYENWFQYLSTIPNCIPCIQTTNTEELIPQLEKMERLNRGIVVRLLSNENEINSNEEIIRIVLNHCNQTQDLLFIFDFEGIDRNSDLSEYITNQIPLLNRIANGRQNFKIAISSTSFPSGFEGIDQQDIIERQLYNVAVASNENDNWNLLYSDKASVRANQNGGGGGNAPYPRIDYPTGTTWHFKRSETNNGDKNDDYALMSRQTMSSPYWNDDINIFGTQMIRETAAENIGSERFFIRSPAKATAARINIHLHQQLFFNDVAGILDTEDEWVD